MKDKYEIAQDLYYKGREALDAGEFSKALDLFNRSIENNIHYKTLELIGNAYIKLEEYSKAIIPLAAATSLNDGPKAPSLLAEAYLNLGEIDNATRMANKSLNRLQNYGPAKKIIELIKIKNLPGS